MLRVTGWGPLLAVMAVGLVGSACPTKGGGGCEGPEPGGCGVSCVCEEGEWVCGGPGCPESDGSASAVTSDGSATAATATTSTTGTSTTTTTTTTTAAGTGSSTTAEDPCGSSCGGVEDCLPVDTDGDDGCMEGFHCVDDSACGCNVWICEPDCDPEDPRTCPGGLTCDAKSGRCV